MTNAEKINNCYLRLQKLDINPTRNNLEILLQTLYDLKEVFDGLGVTDDAGRTTADTEGRDKA